MKRFKSLVAIFMAAAMLITTPMGSYASTTAADQTLTWATFSDPIDFNPALSKDSASSDITQFIFRGLYVRDWNSKFVPDLASAMPKVSADSKTITIALRKDVKWHDGKPFTSADVKFSYEFILNKSANSPRYSNFEKIAKIETPDPYTVVIKMSSVDSSIIATLSYP